MEPKHIFITGGTGFVGKPLVKLLEKNGYRLLLLARSPEKYRHFFDAKKTELVRGDLGNFKTWPKVVLKFKPDIAIHLAWEGIPDFRPAICARNLKYGIDLYEFLGNISCKTVITTGSCWEYGNAEGKISENNPILPNNAFVVAKDTLQNLGREIAKVNGQNFIWLRLFYVYGPGQKKTSLIPYLINCLKTGEEAKINDPDVAHDFVYVENVAEAITMIANHKWMPGQHVFNIGSGRLISVGDIVDFILKDDTNFSRNGAGFYANLSKIKKEIGWQPKTGIMDGLSKTKQYFMGL